MTQNRVDILDLSGLNLGCFVFGTPFATRKRTSRWNVKSEKAGPRPGDILPRLHRSFSRRRQAPNGDRCVGPRRGLQEEIADSRPTNGWLLRPGERGHTLYPSSGARHAATPVDSL